ncbi:MAG: SpoIIE family protein phosphatase [Flavobacteriales bacterium]
MTKALRSTVCALVTTLSMLVQAQTFNDLLSQAMSSPPGKERAKKLIELSQTERNNGKLREAVQFAILGSSEAEKNGLSQEMGQAFMALAEAHRAKGDLENAIGASTRATMVDGNLHSKQRTDALIQLADLYVTAGHPQKALEHLDEAEKSTSAAKMDRSKFIRIQTKAKSLILAPAALVTYCQSIRPEVAKGGDRKLMLELLSTTATAQANSKMNQDALTTENEVMKLAIALDKPFEAGICSNNVGELNLRMGHNEEALLAFGKGLIMVEDVPLLRLSMLINAANAQAITGNQDAATRSIDDAERMARKGQFNQVLPRLLRTKSAVQMLQGDLVSAQNTGFEALASAEDLKDEQEQVAACDMLAEIFEQRDLSAEARTFNNKAREIEKNISSRDAQSKNDRDSQLLRLQRIERDQVDLLNREIRKEDRLRQLSTDAENRDKAMALLQYEKQLEESARREAIIEKEKSINELKLTQAELDAERQSHQIQELDKNRMLQSLSLSKMALERKEQQRTNELLTKRNELVEAEKKTLAAQQEHDRAVTRFYILLAVGSVLLACYMAWAWNVTRRKKRTISEQNEKITVINEELAKKNNDIKSSLVYAQTIQSAILPTEADLQRNLPESFLLYKPLDIVSGDLPFMKRIGDKLFIAAIDCTGHGVPAAMMTFIAYYGLSDMLAQDASLHCGELLDQLHEHVKHTMEARGEENLYSDGFDIGLCSIDLKTGDLSFSGAQLPLILVSGPELTRIKGDVLPLGDSHFKRKSGYKEHRMKLKHGDSLFLFSDGMIHQFGGDTGRKKFSMRKLTEMLQGAADMDLAAIKELADGTFNEWKGNSQQTDDVLLIGLRYAA